MAKPKSIPVFDGHNDTLLHLAIKSPGSEEGFRDGYGTGTSISPAQGREGWPGGSSPCSSRLPAGK